jgi:hypothetical protein
MFRLLETILRRNIKECYIYYSVAQWTRSLSLTSAQDGVGDQRHALAALPPGKRHGSDCVRGWVVARAGLGGCGKSRPPTRIRSPYLSARSESLYRLSYSGPTLKL